MIGISVDLVAGVLDELPRTDEYEFDDLVYHMSDLDDTETKPAIIHFRKSEDGEEWELMV